MLSLYFLYIWNLYKCIIPFINVPFAKPMNYKKNHISHEIS